MILQRWKPIVIGYNGALIGFTMEDSGKVSIFIFVFVLCILGYNFIRPYFEVNAFNRLTGSNATYFDALFVELRVDCSNVKK